VRRALLHDPRPTAAQRHEEAGHVDVTDVILDQHQIFDQHHEQRRMFAVLDELPRDDAEASAAVWGRLEVLLEVHAEAEERFSHPPLLAVGEGTADGTCARRSRTRSRTTTRSATSSTPPAPTRSDRTTGGRRSGRRGRPTTTTWARRSGRTCSTPAGTRTCRSGTTSRCSS